MLTWHANSWDIMEEVGPLPYSATERGSDLDLPLLNS